MASLRRWADGPADGEPQAQRQSRRSAVNGEREARQAAPERHICRIQNGRSDGAPAAAENEPEDAPAAGRQPAVHGDQNELEDRDVPSEDTETVEAGAAAPAAAAAGWQPSAPGQLSHMQRERLDSLKTRVEELRETAQSFKDMNDPASMLAVMRMKHEVEGDLVRTDALSLPHLAVRISIVAPNIAWAVCCYG